MSAAGTLTEPKPDRPKPRAGVPRPVRNVLSNWGAFVFAAVVNFSLSPFVVHSLGDAAYGTWVLTGAIVGYLGLLDLGVRGAVTRYVARMHAAADHGDAGRTASAALFLFSTAGGLAIIASAILAYFVGSVFQVPDQLLPAARMVLVIGGVNVAVSLIGGVYGGVVAALQRFDLNSGLDVVIEALRATAIVIALVTGLGLIGIAIVQLSAATLRVVGQYVITRRLYPQLRLSLRAWGRPELRLIFGFSIYSTFLHIAGVITLQTDSLVIGAYLPVSMITAYAIAASLTNYARVISAGVSQTLTPQVSALEGSGSRNDIRVLTLAGIRLSTLVMLPIVATFLLRGSTFIGLWMGEQYAEPAGQILFILSIALWIATPRYVISSIVIGLGRHRILVPPYFGEALANLALSVVLVQTMGTLGVAWGTAIPNVIVSLVFVPWCLRRVLDIPIRSLLFIGWVRPTVAMIPFMIASYIVDRLWATDSILLFFAQVAATLPAALAGAWLLGMTGAERKAMLDRVRPSSVRAAGAQ